MDIKQNGGEHAHVHFEAEQVKSHDLEIQLKYVNEGHIEVHLGFLQMFHHYTVKFCIRDRLTEDIVADPSKNLYVQLKDYSPTEDGQGHNIEVEFHAIKDKLVNEVLTIKSSTDESQTVELMFKARVMGKGKGVPAIKNGIHCYKVDAEDDTDANSDWQGFN
ncbi:adipose-secreted signaling protein-like [Ylistrum balloti]|uniref:adipose-secreted signaling protein-like n=1 Tax=Ylistrum balloti TaxID=509963 RepID=UPI002905BCF9|nr:adipose-secreted signaling protein-like [Ylistrum balloti]